MPYNLIHEPWIPVRRQSGRSDWIAPWQIAEGDDAPVALDAVRPDFNGALIQFLIGLTQTCFAPENDREWRKHLKTPPTPDALRVAFSKYAHAFNLDGDGPRFMQDLELKDGKSREMESLFLDAPGEQTIEQNKDFFVKRGRLSVLGPEAAAVALFTLQLNAPPGGQGYREGLRKSGPLTTLVMGDRLWDTVWLNVLPQAQIEALLGRTNVGGDESVFPWLRPTQTSENDEIVTPQQVAPLHMFWGMPWRIRLDIKESECCCDMTGKTSPISVVGFIKKSYGTKYQGWIHSLSPFVEEEDGAVQCYKLRDATIHYKHWLGLVLNGARQKQSVAPTIRQFLERSARPDWQEVHNVFQTPPRLWAFAYEMDQMKARAWREGILPLITVEETIREAYESLSRRVVMTAEKCCFLLRQHTRKALFSKSAEVRGDLGFVDQRFWQETESDFFGLLGAGIEPLKRGDSLDTLKTEWLRHVWEKALRIFEEVTQTQQIEVVNPRRVALALIGLKKALSENSRSLREMLDLPVTVPAQKMKRKTT